MKVLSWPCWLTYSGRFTHINGYPSAAGPVQTSESSPIRDRGSTTEPPNQLVYNLYNNNNNIVQVRPVVTVKSRRNVLKSAKSLVDASNSVISSGHLAPSDGDFWTTTRPVAIVNCHRRHQVTERLNDNDIGSAL